MCVPPTFLNPRPRAGYQGTDSCFSFRLGQWPLMVNTSVDWMSVQKKKHCVYCVFLSFLQLFCGCMLVRLGRGEQPSKTCCGRMWSLPCILKFWGFNLISQGAIHLNFGQKLCCCCLLLVAEGLWIESLIGVVPQTELHCSYVVPKKSFLP